MKNKLTNFLLAGLVAVLVWTAFPQAQTAFYNSIAWATTGKLAFSSVTPMMLDTNSFGSNYYNSNFASGFTTGAITRSNGPGAFRVVVGGAASWSGTIGMPTASNGWNCFITNQGGPAYPQYPAALGNEQAAGGSFVKQVRGFTTNVHVWNIGTTGLLTTAWNANDVLAFQCGAF